MGRNISIGSTFIFPFSFFFLGFSSGNTINLFFFYSTFVSVIGCTRGRSTGLGSMNGFTFGISGC